jgi:hypothetical protein
LVRAHIPPDVPNWLGNWADAPAILMSCPGPLRRHHAAVQPISQLALPQCLLGSEAQLIAFAAAEPALAPRLFFAPLPEMFAGAASLDALYAACGLDPAARGTLPRLVHLRFGGTRSARLLKDARNALMLAENHRTPPISASRHPFASGLTVPAAMRRVLTLDPEAAIPAALGGGKLPHTFLEADTIRADLRSAGGASAEGLDIVSFAEFRSNMWAAGPIRAQSADLQAAQTEAARDGAPFVLVPWNLDHPGSAVPALVTRTLRLQTRERPVVRLVILPFNYPGQTGLIRRLIRQIRDTIEDGAAALPHLFLGRLSRLEALPTLRGLARAAWVDGNDPEQGWTMRRLKAAGFAPVLLAAAAPPADTLHIMADDALTLEAGTRFGLLHFHIRLPSLRGLRTLLALTQDMPRAKPLRAPAPRARRTRRIA